MKRYALLLLYLLLTVSIQSKAIAQENKGTSHPYNSLQFEALPTSVVNNFLNHQKTKHVLVEPDYYVWGLSVVQWEGKYHAYYSRWKRKHGHDGWMTHCEIAHAEATKPEGPFKFVNVVLKKKNSTGWDINNAHNPYAIVVDKKINLYYIANDLQPLLKTTSYPDSTWFAKNRKRIRNSQRIGLASSKHPNGPFVRTEKAVVSPDDKLFKNIAVNPSIVYHDNTYTMIMKGDDVNKKKWFRIQLVGQSPNAEGPFKFSSKPVYSKAQTEDACIWYDKTLKKYFMVCHVMRKPNLALFQSENGTDWQPNQRGTFMKKYFKLKDGTIWKPERVERPFVLTNEKGQPIMVYVAVADKNVNGNIAIPIHLD